MFKKMNLTIKITVLLGSIILLGLAVISFLELQNTHSNSYDQALTLAKEVLKGYANDISGDFEVANATVNGVYNTLVFAKKNNSLTREGVIQLLRTTLEKTPSILAVYTLWEPNAFDGKDTEYIGKEGHDSLVDKPNLSLLQIMTRRVQETTI